MSKDCGCSVAKALGGRLAELDAELRGHGHRSFRKLAEAYGLVGQKSAIERHKHRCLQVGAPFEAPPVKDPPRREPVRMDHVPRVPEVSQGQSAEVGTVDEHVPRARAPEAVKPAKSLVERTAYIVSQIASGTWDSGRDIERCAAAWGLHEGSVRNEVRVIFATRRANRGDVTAMEEESVAFYRWQLDELQAVLLDCIDPDEKAKLHARITEVRARIDAILIGTKTRATVDVNIFSDPRFVEAARRFVDAVQNVLDAPDVIAERLAAGNSPAPPELVAAVLAEADALIRERLAPNPPLLVETT